MNGLRRTLYCGEALSEKIGERAVVAGFVARVRDKGTLIFVDLRDRSGIVQLAFDETSSAEVLKKAHALKSEYVVMAAGILRRRESVNRDIPTGEVEMFVDELRVLSEAETTPFEIRDDINTREELRLRYRYLDLRRPSLQHSMLMRHKIAKAARDFYDENGFMEIETPVLIRSTPEGARDYLVPSRVQNGRFYALPQSPQLYKQLLMISGFDRYFQIARCFRDEDLRADRQPEFSQIDLEMSFADENDIMELNERFLQYCFKRILDIDVKLPLRRMDYDEAMERFGSDKPDTRFGLELKNISDLAFGSGFSVFENTLAAGGSVRALNAKGLADKLSRKEIDRLTEFVKTYGAKGLAYTRLTAESESSSYEKQLLPSAAAAIRDRLGAETGDVIFIVAAEGEIPFAALGALRLEIAKKHSLIPEDTFDMLWVVNFPLFEYADGRWYAKHHPFTAPAEGDLERMASDPGACHAKAYDIVINGTEAGGGSIRISDPDTQLKAFAALGIDEETAKKRFGFLVEAYRYGAPPHGGMAFGLDRLVMLMLRDDNIRDVIAFPKVQTASELMSGCPAEVDDIQLEELGIAVTAEDPETV